MRGTKPGVLHRVAVCTSAVSLWIGLTAAASTPVVAAEPVRDEAAVVASFIKFIEETSARRHPTGTIKRFNKGRAAG